MINTLDIGKYIYSTLNGSSSIDCKVYPLIADNDAKFPFIIYKRINLQSNGCKDGLIEDDVEVEITVVSDKYSTSIELASNVRSLLEKQHAEYSDLNIDDASITLASEEFSNNSFIQRLHFNFKITN